jgi:MFS family permease
VDVALATSLLIIGALVGSMLASAPMDAYGRRKSLLYNNIFYVVGAALSASGNVYNLYIGRFISGLGMGVTSVVVPVLLSEIASDNTRGALTTQYHIFITFGILISALVAYGFVTYLPLGWQYTIGVGAVPAIIMTGIYFFSNLFSFIYF